MKAWRWLVFGGLLTGAAEASTVRIIVDGEGLDQIAVEPTFILPDGSSQTWQSLLADCFAQQGAGVLVYDPDFGSCRPFELALPSERADAFDLGAGLVIFDTLTRETCLPGKCVVTVGGAPAGGGSAPVDPTDPIFADGFELLVPQS